MNLSEFKAWFEGFTENLDGPPGEKQWVKICAKVKAITADPTPWPQFIREYVPWYRQYPWYGVNVPYQAMLATAQTSDVICGSGQNADLQTPNQAFQMLGRMDAQAT